MSPRIVFDASKILMDQPLSLRVVDVRPGSRVTLRASCVDSSETTYNSWAEFEAGANQIVDPSKQSPLAGTYQGVDPFGLWWSMVSVPERLFPRNLRPIPTLISAEIAGERVAQVELRRLRIATDVRVESVRSGALTATLFFPDTLARAPGIMVLGGSEGGLSLAEEHAALLASRGFAALAVAYFAVAGLPPRLVEIPLEYVERAARWLLCQPRVSGPGIGVVATSRGVELALLLASVFPRVCAVVGFAGSCVMWQGFTSGLHPRAAWTRRGKDLPFAIPQPQPPLPGSKGPLVCRQWFLAALPKQRSQNNAIIPLERIRGAVLLVSGGDDKLWPSRLLAQRAMRRLAVSQAVSGARGHLHLSYSRAGHGVVPMPGLPAPPTVLVGQGGTSYDLGGSKSGNARSAQHAWPRVFSFLSEHLEGPAAASSTRRHRCA